ncbi:uncharacterized protein LOC134566054 [Pelobates fuscus]|uniref:uncharacterized protein LOC134566054 n=1 Tax=Pelobates fuscus TaxID=191477 RepID=UPI002FE48BE6
MGSTNGQPDETDQSIKTSLQHFFARHKVPMCIAITHTNMFFEELKENGILSEDDLLELNTIPNVKRVVYKSLCLIEKKTQPSRFFDVLLQKPFLVKYPDLAPISRKYKAKKYECVYTTSSKSASLRRFFQEKKVAISYAIKKRFPFLNGLQDLAILSEREALKLQTDERSVHQVIYESLCWIEKKNVQIEIILDYIFLDCFLKIFPELMSISHEYGSEDVECVAPISANNDILKRMFKQQKVAICLAITKRFPFLHGLQDVGLLSELELLKLQADERSTQHVVYESLCWIEEKEKESFKVFFVYIFQKCFLNFYCKLNIISQQIKTQADPVNICPISTEELKLILKREKTHISDAINLLFPFMNGLQDRGILSELELLNIQAEEWTVMKVVHKTLCLIEAERTHLLQDFFAYLSQDMYLEMFPKLKEILERILQNDTTAQRLGNRISKEPDINESGVKGVLPGIDQGQDYREESPTTSDIEESENVRNEKAHSTSNLGSVGTSEKQMFDKQRLAKKRRKPSCIDESEVIRKVNAHSTTNLAPVKTPRYINAISKRIPRQAYNEQFSVKCGTTMGTFFKNKWNGGSAGTSEKQMFDKQRLAKKRRKPSCIDESEVIRKVNAHSTTNLGSAGTSEKQMFDKQRLAKKRRKPSCIDESEVIRNENAHSTTNLGSAGTSEKQMFDKQRLAKKRRKPLCIDESEVIRKENAHSTTNQAQVKTPRYINAISKRIPRQAYNEQFSVKCGTTMGTFFKNKWNGGSAGTSEKQMFDKQRLAKKRRKPSCIDESEVIRKVNAHSTTNLGSAGTSEKRMFDKQRLTKKRRKPSCIDESEVIRKQTAHSTTNLAQVKTPRDINAISKRIPRQAYNEQFSVKCGTTMGTFFKNKWNGAQVENPSDIDAISERIPRQANNEEFSVKCGTTMGTFFKNKWNGGSSTDECIESNGTFYTVIGFESHGGRESWKCWKRSITCEGVKLEVLVQNGILQAL